MHSNWKSSTFFQSNVIFLIVKNVLSNDLSKFPIPIKKKWEKEKKNEEKLS